MNNFSPSVAIQIVTFLGLPVLRPYVVRVTSFWRAAVSNTLDFVTALAP